MSRNSWKDYSKKGLAVGKKGFDKAWSALDKLGAPANRLSHKVGAEAFWPTTLDKECDKAARILRSFCKDGFYNKVDSTTQNQQLENRSPDDVPRGKQRVLIKIPTSVIRNAKGLAIFTTLRTGLWISGAGGSGILLARIPETGEWSPPSGILLHTAGVGFLAGLDIYDCVVVINTDQALEGFKKLRCTLGGEISATAGPVGIGGILDTEVHARRVPIWTYMKSRGIYAGAQVDGTIIIERTDENERFYGERIPVNDILRGKLRHPPSSIRPLMQTIKAAQGDLDVDESVIPPPGGAPSDAIIEPDPSLSPSSPSFGIPAVDDADPYGVQALESEGLFIREAGTKVRPSKEVFEFRPSPTSPVYQHVNQSSDDFRRSWRASSQSSRNYSAIDRSTQTEPVCNADPMMTPPARPASGPIPVSTPEAMTLDSEELQRSFRKENYASSLPSPLDTPILSSDEYKTHVEDADDHGEIEIHEVGDATLSTPEIAEIAVRTPSPGNASTGAQPETTQMTKPRLVTIPKRPRPPALPPRNPDRKHDSFSTQSSGTPASPSPTSSTHPEIHDYTDFIHTYETSDRFYDVPEMKPNVLLARPQEVRSGAVNGELTTLPNADEYRSIIGHGLAAEQ